MQNHSQDEEVQDAIKEYSNASLLEMVHKINEFWREIELGQYRALLIVAASKIDLEELSDRTELPKEDLEQALNLDFVEFFQLPFSNIFAIHEAVATIGTSN